MPGYHCLMTTSRHRRPDRNVTTEMQVRESMVKALDELHARGLDDARTAAIACRWSRSAADGALLLIADGAGAQGVEWSVDATDDRALPDPARQPRPTAGQLALAELARLPASRCTLVSTPRHLAALASTPAGKNGLPLFHPCMMAHGPIECVQSPIVTAALEAMIAPGEPHRGPGAPNEEWVPGLSTGSPARPGKVYLVASWGLVVHADTPSDAVTMTAGIEAFAAVHCTRLSLGAS